jgi:histidine triad (HIT) family protein
MSGCVFCDVVAGAAGAEIVHEAPGAIAFLDKFPAARGHTMIVPRTHAATLLDLDDASADDLFRTVKAVMRKIDGALHPAGMNVGWNHGKAAGQHVFHLHVHVLPRYAPGGRGVQLLGEGTEPLDLADVARRIRAG